jgi:hypothetical protein
MDLAAKRLLRGCFGAILDHVKRSATALRLPSEEADTAGEALVRLDPAKAAEVFRDWATPPRFYQFVPPGRPSLLRTAVSGLAFLPGDDAEKLIRQVEKQGDEDLRRHCVQAMVKRRRLQRGTT